MPSCEFTDKDLIESIVHLTGYRPTVITKKYFDDKHRLHVFWKWLIMDKGTRYDIKEIIKELEFIKKDEVTKLQKMEFFNFSGTDIYIEIKKVVSILNESIDSLNKLTGAVKTW